EAHAEHLARGHERPRADLCVDVADLAARDRLAQAFDVPVGELLVVVVQHLRRDERGLADDRAERRVLGGEAEVRAEAEQLRLEARRPLRRRLLHRVAHAAVQVADELVEDVLLRGEVEVERPLPNAGGLGDLHDRRVVEADVAEDLLRRLEQAAACLDAARGECAPVGAVHRHAATSVRSDCFWILPSELRGTSATKRTEAGTLKRASRSVHQATSSSSVTSSATTNAAPTSPQRSCGTPTTAASRTCGCSCSTASTSAGYTFSPPEMYMSLSRPLMR